MIPGPLFHALQRCSEQLEMKADGCRASARLVKEDCPPAGRVMDAYATAYGEAAEMIRAIVSAA